MSSPERETGPVAGTGPKQDAKSSTQSSGKALVWIPCIRTFPQDTASQLRRRRGQATRSVPLFCGCRDPFTCRCTEPPLTERELDGWRDAVWHVLDASHMPLVPIEVRRALWRRGGHDRELAELLHDACGEVAT
jgi:hypothetical protein